MPTSFDGLPIQSARLKKLPFEAYFREKEPQLQANMYLPMTSMGRFRELTVLKYLQSLPDGSVIQVLKIADEPERFLVEHRGDRASIRASCVELLDPSLLTTKAETLWLAIKNLWELFFVW